MIPCVHVPAVGETEGRFSRRVAKHFAIALISTCIALTSEASALSLRWVENPEPDVATYEVTYGTSPDEMTEVIDSGGETAVSLTGLQAGVTYYFAVAAINTSGLKSEPSEVVSYELAVDEENLAEIPSGGWSWIDADSHESGEYGPDKAFDGDVGTIWHSAWSDGGDELPHELTVDLGGTYPVTGFRYLPRQDQMRVGEVGGYEFYLSADGVDWGKPAASGVFEFTKDEKQVVFLGQDARYVRFVALSDQSGGKYTAVAELVILADAGAMGTANAAPVAADLAVAAVEDTAVEIELSAADADDEVLDYAVVGLPGHGTLTGSAPQLVYTPDADYHGTDSFTFRADDGTAVSNLATVTLSVEAVNDAPVALGGLVTVEEDSPVRIILNGSDADGDPLVYSVIGLPSHGVLSGTPTNLTYTPTADFHGADFLSFRVSDGTAYSSVEKVEIEVEAVNDAPVAAGLTIETMEDTDVPVVLSATDAEGDSMTYVVVSQPEHGTLSGVAPDLSFRPDADFSGTDTFSYSANDGYDVSEPATVTITVVPVNDPPVAAGSVVETDEDCPVRVVLNAGDADGDVLVYSVVGLPVNGSLSGSPTDLTYTPDENFHGSDFLQFLVRDGTSRSEVALVELQVAAVNDAPVAADGVVATSEGMPVSLSLSASDVDGDALEFQVVDGPLNGTLSGTAPDLGYTPYSGFTGSDSVSFIASDGEAESAVAVVSITVEPDADRGTSEIARDGWSVSFVDSQDAAKYPAVDAIDGDTSSFWHTRWDSGATNPPHEVQIDLGAVYQVDGFSVLPRQDASDVGNIGDFEFHVSADGEDWGAAVASGRFANTKAEKKVTFSGVGCRYVRLIAVNEVNGHMHTSIAELNVFGGPVDDSSSLVVSDPTLASTRPELTRPDDLKTGTSKPEVSKPVVEVTEVSKPVVTKPGSDKPVTSRPQVSKVKEATLVPRDDWEVVYVDSQDAAKYPARNVHDGLTSSFWHTRWDSAGATPPPHEIRIDLGGFYQVEGFRYLPRQDASMVGNIGDYEFYVSADGEDWGSPATTGTFADTKDEKEVSFAGVFGRYVRLRALNETHGYMHSSMAEFNVLGREADNSIPGADDFTVEVDQGSSAAVLLTGSDPDGDALDFTVESGPAHGTLSGTAPELTYTPEPDYFGGDSFSYTASDGVVTSAAAVVEIVVVRTEVAEVAVESVESVESVEAEEAPDPGLESVVFTRADALADDAVLTIDVDIDAEGVPLPWSVKQLGGDELAMPATHGDEGMTLQGAGHLDGKRDGGTFVWRVLRGDGRISARVRDFSATAVDGQAGVMIRDSLAANSKYVFLGVDGSRTYQWMRRNLTNAEQKSTAKGEAVVPDVWVRLKRDGERVISFTSHDGKEWEKVASSNVEFGKSCYIGLMVGGEDDEPGEASFGKVKVQP
ncbi:MAG: Ig-like domain-containing protein [Verrucomicrobiota bacterium JB025]|nr:Ig-like domain-containing protein [Verrucomicrobiota bacterium JB025]